jgi:uncharacterized protein YjbJ (UPF0337 family)
MVTSKTSGRDYRFQRPRTDLLRKGRKKLPYFTILSVEKVLQPTISPQTYREEGTMKPSTKDQAEGKFHEVKGKVKEVAGKLSDNPELEAEGKVEKITGKVQDKIGQVEKVLGK